MLVARLRGAAAEYDADQPPAVARDGRREIKTGCPDIAGLNTVGAGIGAKQVIVILEYLAAEAIVSSGEVVVLARKIADQALRQ